MIPIYTVKQIKTADATTVNRQAISFEDLMERASKATLPDLEYYLSDKENNSLYCFCGKGNNGGDGLAIARLMKEKHYKVSVWVPNNASSFSMDAAINLQKLERMGVKIHVFGKETFPLINVGDVFLDALIGTGMKGTLDPSLLELINFINAQKILKISIDIPSGLRAEEPTLEEAVVRNSLCLTFQFPKLAFFWPENAGCPMDFKILDIGIDETYISETKASAYFLQEQDLVHALKLRSKFMHKGNFGHALLVAGSYTKAGASILAAKATLRSGAGLLTVSCPECNIPILQISVPEAMVERRDPSKILDLNKYAAIAIGPGLGLDEEAKLFLKTLIQNTPHPLILDADAITILSENKTYLSFLPPYCIFTPHYKELERLLGKWSNSGERLLLQQEFSDKYRAIVVFKGAHSCITSPKVSAHSFNPTLFNSTGNPGMATAGSGDVLTGIILGLLAQGYSSLESAYIGVYLHGLCGDLAVENLSQTSLIAGDLIDFLPDVFSRFGV
ncbi:MAG: NAD(P)H-hydrate dehydratase [Bacteroidales bacterium]